MVGAHTYTYIRKHPQTQFDILVLSMLVFVIVLSDTAKEDAERSQICGEICWTREACVDSKPALSIRPIWKSLWVSLCCKLSKLWGNETS